MAAPARDQAIPPVTLEATSDKQGNEAPLQSGQFSEIIGNENGEGVVMLSDEVLTSVQNATMVLRLGIDQERLAVLYQFPQFLEHCPDDTLSVMVPEICNVENGSPTWPPNIQMAAAESLYFIVNLNLQGKGEGDLPRRILKAALEIIHSAVAASDVFDAWGEILSMVLPQVERDDVLNLVVPAIVEHAKADMVESRRLAARVIGSLNDSLDAKELEAKFLNQALELSEDEDSSVRAMIAQSMTSVGSKLPIKIVEEHLWPRLMILMNDEDARVRAAALRAIARSAEAHKDQHRTSPLFKTFVLPLFKKECEKAAKIAAKDLRAVSDDMYLMLEIFSEVYGYFLCAVSPLFDTEDTWTIALNALRRMVTCNGPTVRHWSAFNMPSVSLVCGKTRTDKIKGVVQALATDTDVETRATLAAGIHVTTKLLCDGAMREEVIHSICELMTDQNPQVRMHALEHFAELIELLHNSSVPKSNGFAEILRLRPIFERLNMIAEDSWRVQELLARQLERAAPLIPQELLVEKVAPVLFEMARESTYLVRKSSMQALIRTIRYISDTKRRRHILRHFKNEWSRGKVYWTRIAYIEGGEAANKLFSSELFRELFSKGLFSMTEDPVPNVRLRLAAFLRELAHQWKDVPEYREALQKLAADKDPEVAREAKIAQDICKTSTGLTKEQKALNEEKRREEKAFFVHKEGKDGKEARSMNASHDSEYQVEKGKQVSSANGSIHAKRPGESVVKSKPRNSVNTKSEKPSGAKQSEQNSKRVPEKTVENHNGNSKVANSATQQTEVRRKSTEKKTARTEEQQAPKKISGIKRFLSCCFRSQQA